MPQPPPRNPTGEVIPHDHPEILDGHNVIRRISEKQIVTDAEGHRRISSIAFKPSSDANGGMSVDLEHFIESTVRDPRAFVTTPIWFGSVFFQAGTLRGERLQVGYDPIQGNEFHGEVWGVRTRAQSRRLQELAAWYVEIPDVQIAGA